MTKKYSYSPLVLVEPESFNSILIEVCSTSSSREIIPNVIGDLFGIPRVLPSGKKGVKPAKVLSEDIKDIAKIKR